MLFVWVFRGSAQIMPTKAVLLKGHLPSVEEVDNCAVLVSGSLFLVLIQKIRFFLQTLHSTYSAVTTVFVLS